MIYCHGRKNIHHQILHYKIDPYMEYIILNLDLLERFRLCTGYHKLMIRPISFMKNCTQCVKMLYTTVLLMFQMKMLEWFIKDEVQKQITHRH